MGLYIVRVGILLTAMVCIPSSALAQNGTVSPGDRGQINQATLGCAQQSDMSALMDALMKADDVHDSVGRSDALQVAIQSGCQSFAPGDAGLVIDTTGIFDVYDQMRMDSDHNAYWFPDATISPATAQAKTP